MEHSATIPLTPKSEPSPGSLHEMDIPVEQLPTLAQPAQVPIQQMPDPPITVPEIVNPAGQLNIVSEPEKVKVQPGAIEQVIVPVPATLCEQNMSDIVTPLQQVVTVSQNDTPIQTDPSNSTASVSYQGSWYQPPQSDSDMAAQPTEPVIMYGTVEEDRNAQIASAEYVQLPHGSMELNPSSESAQGVVSVVTTQYMPEQPVQSLAGPTTVEVPIIEANVHGDAGSTGLILPECSSGVSVPTNVNNVAVLSQEGQAFEVKTSDQLQSGVVYVLTQDPSRVPTKASKKAFVPEGQAGGHQILIFPDDGKKVESGEVLGSSDQLQVIRVLSPQAVKEDTEEMEDSADVEDIGQLEKEFQSETSTQKSHKCHTCGESFFMYLELLRHVMSAHSNALPPQDPETALIERDPPEQYECSDCKLRFKKVDHLNEHIAMHFAMKAGEVDQEEEMDETVQEKMVGIITVNEGDEDPAPRKQHEKKYACEVCERKFTRAFSLKNHMLVHTGQKPFECEVCNKTFREQAKLKNHMAVHMDAKPHICPVCAKAFSAAAYLRTHMMIHTGKKPYKCSDCDMAFISSGNLKRHMRVHTGEKPFTCDFCGASFAQMGNLESHKRTHTGVRPYECEICGKGFMQSSGLVEHIRTHSGVKPYSCDVCGRAFAGSSGLRVHKRTHTGEKPHECDICLKRFAASGNLKTHKKIHDNVRPFKCEYCGKCFVASGNLTQHLRIHTGEKPHKCTICDKAFTGTGGLKIHMMGHYDEKPFMCEYCDKGFKTKQKLTAHTRSHTGERPFPCTTCGKAFAMAEKLKAHVKAKHVFPNPKNNMIVIRGVAQAGTVADFDDDLGPPVLSPQPMTPIHAPPLDPPTTTASPPPRTTSPPQPSTTGTITVVSTSPRTRSSSRIHREKQRGAKARNSRDAYKFDEVTQDLKSENDPISA